MSRKRDRIDRNRLAVQAIAKKNEILAKQDVFKKQQLLRPWLISDKTKLDIKIYAKDKCIKDLKSSAVDKVKIVVYTSLSPSHTNTETQLEAVKSWNELGLEIYSFNSVEETQILQKSYPDYINFINCTKTSKHIFGKPYVLINEMIDHFNYSNNGNVLMLINSDIILKSSNELLNKIKSISSLGILISSRHDYKNELLDGEKYIHGFDVFFIHKKFAKIFPPSMYSMGQTWWDYWLPYTALKNRVSVFRIAESFAFHKEHQKQYNEKDWHRMTQYFRFEHDISENNSQIINDSIWQDIINNSIVI